MKDFIKRYRLAVFAVFLFLWVGGMGIAVTAISLRKAERIAPHQPVNFSHRVHIKNAGLNCVYCHQYVESSPSAGAPAVEVCIKCHNVVAKDRPQIVRLRRHWEEKTPIEWVRVYSIPDFIYFTHKRHVKAGLDCSVCHGDVANMERMGRVRKLNMGWCIGCHRKRNAPIDCVTCHK